MAESWLESISGFTDDVFNQLGRLRYGMPTSEKERLARSGALPGTPPLSESAEEADRYAAGYLTAREWPNAAPVIMPFVNQLKTSDLPLLGGDSIELQSWAQTGTQRALQDQALADGRAVGMEAPRFAPPINSPQALSLRRPASPASPTPTPAPAPSLYPYLSSR